MIGVIAAHYAAGAPPASLTLVGTQWTYAGGFTVSMNYPAGIQAGDLLLLQMSSDNGISIPSGWTGTQDDPGGWIRGATMWKVATSTDVTNGYVSVGTGGGDGKGGMLSAVRGASSAAIVFHDAVPSPGDSAEAVAVPAGSGLLVYAGLNRAGGSPPTIDRGTQSATGSNWHSGLAKTEDAGGAVTVNFATGVANDGTYYSVARVTA